MVKIRVAAKSGEFIQKLKNINRKCADLKDRFPCFGWEFFTVNGKTHFTASYRDGDESSAFEFPIQSVSVDDRYKYIMDQLNELYWSAIFWKKEERHGAEH